MSSRSPLPQHSIRTTLELFLEERRSTLTPEELRLYRHVLFFLALCINNYGHRNLDLDERDLCEKHRFGVFGSERDFFEIFGPEKLLPELEFFSSRFLSQDVHTSSRVTERAPEVVEDLERWLVETRRVTPEAVETERQRARRRTRAALRCRRIARRLERRVLSLDPGALAPSDYVPDDHHVVIRTGPGRIWLRVYRSPEAEEIGPLLVPPETARGLVEGARLRCALGRVRGRWHFVALSDLLPEG
jgi:hypothetical protein